MLHTQHYLFCGLLALSTAAQASQSPLKEELAFGTPRHLVAQSTTFAQDSLQYLIKQGTAFTQKTFNCVKQNPLPVTAVCLLLSIGTAHAYRDYYPLRAIFKGMPSPYNTELCEGLTLTKEYATLLEAWDTLYAKQLPAVQEAFNRYVRPKICCISNLLSANNPEDLSVAYCNAQSFS
ncbi:MAG: hypothetical protein ACPG7U_00965 [Holosporaceae bacterium]